MFNSGRQMDELDIQQYKGWRNSGIRPTYRAGGVSAQYDRFIDRGMSHVYIYTDDNVSDQTKYFINIKNS
jgi:hypothetical protein